MNDFFCAAPWRGLHINPRGDVKTCCAGDPNLLGNLNTQSIDQILQSTAMQEIRQVLRQGRPHQQYCKNCVQAERYGRSERQWHNDLNPGFDFGTATDHDHAPVLVDVRWSTTCNLSCNYCDEHSSSQWAYLKKIPFKSGTTPYHLQTCDYIALHQTNIKKLALIGGEPLLLKENEHLLDLLETDCQIDIITNLSVDLETNRVFSKLAQRKNVGWNISFDNIDHKFEYVRHGSNWQLMQKNIQIIKTCPGHRIGIHPLYNIYNATELSSLVDWAKQNEISIHWQSLYHPEFLDPFKLGPKIQELAIDQLQQLLARNDLAAGQRGFMQQVLQNCNKSTLEDLTNNLKNHVSEIENIYHQKTLGQFKKLWPEIAKIL